MKPGKIRSWINSVRQSYDRSEDFKVKKEIILNKNNDIKQAKNRLFTANDNKKSRTKLQASLPTRVFQSQKFSKIGLTYTYIDRQK